jgi:protoheme IX farnesyltransferase
MAFKISVKDYYRLTKPGIVYGNAITATAGFLLASRGHVNLGLLIATVTGICLVIASACVFNNYIDRDIDEKMARTRQRALVIGLVSVRNAIIYAIFLGLIGFWVLATYTNWLTVGIGAAAIVTYVVLYGISKRRSVHGTIIGSIAGATPPVAGYTAVTNHFDGAALLLFLILVCWQMPHFYAIAMYRSADYKAAKLPVLPIKKGFAAAKRQMIMYILAFSLAAIALVVLGYSGYFYLSVVSILSLAWLALSIEGFKAKNDQKWARQMFFVSLLVITLLCLAMSIEALI